MMAVSTSTVQHGMHGSISFPQTHSPKYSQAYEDEELSPDSTFFPTEVAPKPVSPGPLPNPPFVFPARSSPSSAPPSLSRGNRRGLASPTLEQLNREEEKMNDAGGNTRNRPTPLPIFNFGSGSPAASHNSNAPSPHSPITPLSPGMPIPSRAGGHRRGGSEFIGGDGTTGTGTLLSSSPANREAELPSLNPSSVGPSAGRRGHAHRRSAAISCHDLSMVLKPAAGSSSAPTSPSDNEYKRSSFPATLDSTINSEVRTHTSTPSSPERLSNRARVGFSDTLEFIPRPLSLATSESSSTITMKQGHSVSGSLSSIVSINVGSRSSRDIQRYPSPPLDRTQSIRPRTAGAILGGTLNSPSFDGYFTRPKQATQIDLPIEKPSTPTTPRFPSKKFMFFGHESNSSEPSPTLSRPASSESTNKTAAIAEPSLAPSKTRANITTSTESPACKQQRRPSVTKKSKKAKKWSILPRKTRSRSSSLKQQKVLSRRSPTPPLRHYQTLENESANTASAAEVESPSPPRPQVQTDFASWRPRQVSVQDEDSMSPIIDLDAALGPFNTPTGRDLEWEASQRGSGLRKRRMHSAAGVSGFGIPYHRRSESAPQMAAFEYSRMSIHHLPSSSTMADVFEEDEEDDEWEETKSVSHNESKSELDEDEEVCPSPGVEVVDAVDMHDGKPMDWTTEADKFVQRGIKRKSSSSSDFDHRQNNSSLSSEKSTTSLNDPIQEGPAVEPENNTMPSSPGSGGKSSDSTMTPPLRPNTTKNLAPVEVGSCMLQERYLTPSTAPSEDPSPFPSPRSPFSYDAQRISTAPSSLAEDRSFHSLLLGEPGPELRMSVDEVPSLTSSSSTMTGTFNFPPGSSSTNNPPSTNSSVQFRDGQRSVSLSAAAVSRKRSSIASLSRLISSSHGEKSKLSIEQHPSLPEKKEKSSKSKRFSRKLQFWKAKDGDAAPS